MDNLYDELCKICGYENVKLNEPMSAHTTLKVGGRAKYFVTPTSEEEIVKLFYLVRNRKIKYAVVGNGSNLCVSDKGYDGVVINVFKNHSNIYIKENVITAEAGALLAKVGKEALKHSLTGFEELTGIPGTVGGAVAMNAGAYGGEIKDCLISCRVLNTNGNIIEYTNEEMKFGYRDSRVLSDKLVVLSAVFRLEKGDKDNIEAKMKELAQRRRDKQPLEYPSAGSTFKRPQGNFAGKLIEDAGLSGLREGGMEVSQKHCGFVINSASGSAEDFIKLTDEIRKCVFDKYGVELELEVKLLGFD